VNRHERPRDYNMTKACASRLNGPNLAKVVEKKGRAEAVAGEFSRDDGWDEEAEFVHVGMPRFGIARADAGGTDRTERELIA
jgi:hypothetical protein